MHFSAMPPAPFYFPPLIFLWIDWPPTPSILLIKPSLIHRAFILHGNAYPPIPHCSRHSSPFKIKHPHTPSTLMVQPLSKWPMDVCCCLRPHCPCVALLKAYLAKAETFYDRDASSSVSRYGGGWGWDLLFQILTVAAYQYQDNRRTTLL